MTMIQPQNRAQVGCFNALVFGAVALVVVSIVLLVGMDVASEFAEGFNESELEQAEENTTTVCNGMFGGCTGSFQLWKPAFLVVLGVVMVGFIGGLSSQSSGPHQPDGPDNITLVKEQYVDPDGDIQTTVKLEKELSEHLEPYLDDSDVQELDDLLDNGDDTE